MIIGKVSFGKGKVECHRGAMEYGRSIKQLSHQIFSESPTHPDGMPWKRLKTLAIEIARTLKQMQQTDVSRKQ